MRGAHLLPLLTSNVWLVDATYGQLASTLIVDALLHPELHKERLDAFRANTDMAARRAPQSSSPALGTGVAYIPIFGMLAPRASMISEQSGPTGTAIDRSMHQFRTAVANPDVGAIVMDIASPGGQSGLVYEFAQLIRQGAQIKPVFSIANEHALSGAYWLLTAATDVSVTPSGATGSVGAYMMHIDQSKLLEKNGETVTLIQYGENKVDGNPYAPLSDSAREHLMHLVSTAGRMFEQGVADNLGIDVARVHDTFGQGRVFSAQESLKRGMVHRVASFDDVMNLAAAAAATKRKTNASASSVRNSGGMSASRARLELNRSSVRQA